MGEKILNFKKFFDRQILTNESVVDVDLDDEVKEKSEKNEVVECQIRRGARNIIDRIFNLYNLGIDKPWNKKMMLEYSRFDDDPENFENLSYMPANLLIPGEKILKRYRIFEDGESVLRKLFTEKYYKKSEIENVIKSYKNYIESIRDIRSKKVLKYKADKEFSNVIGRIGFYPAGIKDPSSDQRDYGYQNDYFKITDIKINSSQPEKYIDYVETDNYDPSNVKKGTVEEVLSMLSNKYTKEQIKNYAKSYTAYFEFDKKLKSGDIAPYKASSIISYMFINIGFRIKSEYSMNGAYFDITDIDIDKEDSSYLTFIPARRSRGTDKERYRQRTRIGRILRKLNIENTEREIEKFADKLRAEIEEEKKPVDIKIVRGEDISYWYLSSRYVQGGGSLNSSCMSGSGSQHLIKSLYDRFPEKIGLAIMTKGDQLLGRALIWSLDDGRTYMDRIYTVRHTDELKFLKFAMQNNMICRNDGVDGKIEVTLDLKKGNNRAIPVASFPYLDTFYSKNNIGDKLIMSNGY